jgi:hypothetical protein
MNNTILFNLSTEDLKGIEINILRDAVQKCCYEKNVCKIKIALYENICAEYPQNVNEKQKINVYLKESRDMTQCVLCQE